MMNRGTTEMGVNGEGGREEERTEGWPYGEEADGRKGTLRDNYVLQLKPFDLYHFFHNTYEIVSLREGEAWLCLSLCGNRTNPLQNLPSPSPSNYHLHPVQLQYSIFFFFLFSYSEELPEPDFLFVLSV